MVINIKTHPEYKVILQKNCVDDGSMKAFLSEYKTKKAAIITDNNVAKLYLQKVKSNLEQAGLSVFDFVFQSGEQNKSLQTVEKIYDFLCQNEFTRTDIIVALGGGIVGDTAGFAAATFLRGIKYIQIPTTLLAMIDSSVGGKTAVNLKSGKNLVGCFYQPGKVIIDTQVLNTLPQSEWQCGLGEMIKYGAIMDKNLFCMLEQNGLETDIEVLITRCLKIKKKVVELDTMDNGIRQILNFGHTLGHGIEKHSNYSLSHGKAIGIGMAIITKWAEERCITKQGCAKRIENLLKKFNMPVDYPLALDELWQYAVNDKKKKGNRITLALIKEIGTMKLLNIEADRFLNKQIDIFLKPSEFKGKIKVPCSKSMAHRAIFCAMLSDYPCVIKNIDLSDDISASLNIAKALGKKINCENKSITIEGQINVNSMVTLDCNESGTTFRFLLAAISALGIRAQIVGQKRLGERPYDILAKQLMDNGVVFDKQSGLPLNVSGKLKGGEFLLPGNISSQFISGLLIALPLLSEDSKIVLTSELQSASYVDMTLQCMKDFGVKADKTDYGYHIKGNQKYRLNSYSVEGDFSNAAFFLCGAALKGKLEVCGLDKNSLQGDKRIIDILQEMGACIQQTSKGYKISSKELSGIEIDAKNIPDLVPVIAITMAFAKGKSIIHNTQRLKLKECDRQQAIIDILQKMGADAQLYNDDIIIYGGKELCGGVFDGYNDHRIVMSLSIAALKNEIAVKGAQAINKSYPNYLIDYNNVGGQYVISMGK